jgi:hypothetical protein
MKQTMNTMNTMNSLSALELIQMSMSEIDGTILNGLEPLIEKLDDADAQFDLGATVEGLKAQMQRLWAEVEAQAQRQAQRQAQQKAAA